MSDCPTPVVNYQEEFENETFPQELIAVCIHCAHLHSCLLGAVSNKEQALMLLRLLSLDIHQQNCCRWDQPLIMKCLMSLAKESQYEFHCIGHYLC